MSWYAASTAEGYLPPLYIFINNTSAPLTIDNTIVPNLSAYKYLDYVIVGGGGGGGSGTNGDGDSNFGGGGGGSGYMTSSFGSGMNGIIDSTNNFKYIFGAQSGEYGTGGSTFIIQPNLSSITVTIGTGGVNGDIGNNGDNGTTTNIAYSLGNGSPQTLATANGGFGGQAGQLNIGGNGGNGYCGGGGGGGGNAGGSGGSAQSNQGYNGGSGSGGFSGSGGGFNVVTPGSITGGAGTLCGGEGDSSGGGGGGGSGVLYINSPVPPLPTPPPTSPPTTFSNIGGYGAQSTDSSGNWDALSGVIFTGAGGGGGSYRGGTYQTGGIGGSGYAILWFHNNLFS